MSFVRRVDFPCQVNKNILFKIALSRSQLSFHVTTAAVSTFLFENVIFFCNTLIIAVQWQFDTKRCFVFLIKKPLSTISRLFVFPVLEHLWWQSYPSKFRHQNFLQFLSISHVYPITVISSGGYNSVPPVVAI